MMLKKLISRQTCGFAIRSLHYVQGQSPETKVREYFYYIDHQGMLFMDDAKMKNFTSCFKELHFLKFFFKRLKMNDTLRYNDQFPYLSMCGKERNFVRCDDLPIVFTEVMDGDTNEPLLSYNYGARFLTVNFEPEKIYMHPESGRIYHPGPSKTGGIGLLADKLGILWTTEKRFIYGNGEEQPPTEFMWKNEALRLTNELESKLPERNASAKNEQHSKEENNGQQLLHDFAAREFLLILEDGSKAFIKYEFVSDKLLHFLTTQVPVHQQGRGIGKVIVKFALDFCVAHQMTCKSSCWYINDYLTKEPHKKYRKLFF